MNWPKERKLTENWTLNSKIEKYFCKVKKGEKYELSLITCKENNVQFCWM